MKNIEIFDKDGNSLHIGDVIYNFLKDVAIKNGKEVEDVCIGFDNSNWNKNNAPSIYTFEVLDNGYDAKDVFSFGHDDVLKVNCK